MYLDLEIMHQILKAEAEYFNEPPPDIDVTKEPKLKEILLGYLQTSEYGPNLDKFLDEVVEWLSKPETREWLKEELRKRDEDRLELFGQEWIDHQATQYTSDAPEEARTQT